MAKKVDVKLNLAGVRALRKSPELVAGLKAIADGAAGPGWETDTKEMGTRTIASIYSTDPEAIQAELDSHALISRLSSGG